MILLADPISTADPWINLVQFGVLGLVVLGFLTGKIVPGVTYNRCIAEKDKLGAEVDRLHATITDKVVPTLTRATDLMARAAEAERSV